jgi:hypothetical protein
MKGTANHLPAAVSSRFLDRSSIEELEIHPNRIVDFAWIIRERLQAFGLHTLYSNICFLCTRTLLPWEKTVCDHCKGDSPTFSCAGD